MKSSLLDWYAIMSERFIIRDGGGIEDLYTHKIWSYKILNCKTFLQAEEYAIEFSNKTGFLWKVPSVKDFMHILDYECHHPATKFPYWPNFQFWTSTHHLGLDNAWFVDLKDGAIDLAHTQTSFAVRLIRGSYE